MVKGSARVEARRRAALGAMSLLPASVMLAACGAGQNTTSGIPAAPVKPTGKIDFWLLADATVQAGVTEVANQMAPDVIVNVTPIPGGWPGIEEKVTSGLAAGAAPDVTRLK